MSNLDSTSRPPSDRVAYIVKRYPRYSETFIVNEILAHEAAGLPIEIYSIRPPVDTHFQDLISKVRAPVHYLPGSVCKATDFWRVLADAAKRHPRVGSRFESLLKHDPSDVAAAVAVADLAIRNGITHFHAHFASSAASVAWLAHQLTEIPYTITAHAKDIFHEEVCLTELSRKLQSAKATITVSDFNVDYLRRAASIAHDAIVRIYNGIDIERFPYKSPAVRQPIVLAVGRLVEKKGFSVLIDACSILQERGVDFRTRIIGDGPLAGDLQDQVHRLELDRHIDFLGPQPQSMVKLALQEAAVLAAPCVEGSDGNRDGLPTVLLEAMASGTPCVSTPVTGIPEVLIDGRTGSLVPQNRPHDLANALQRLLSDVDVRCHYATNARQHIETSFDIVRNSEVQRELFRRSRSDERESAELQCSIAMVN